MRLTDKRKLLLEALNGQDTALQQLRFQRMKEGLFITDVHGIVDLTVCDPMFLQLDAHFNFPDEYLSSKAKIKERPLREYVDQLRLAVGSERDQYGAAFAFLDPQESGFDSLPLHFTEVIYKNAVSRFHKCGTIGQLREAFRRSAAALDKIPFITLVFEVQSWRLGTYTKAQ